MAISMLKIRRPLGRLIFNMGIAKPGKTVFLIETAPRLLYKYWWVTEAFHTLQYALVTRQSIKEWHKLELGIILVFRVFQKIDSSITSTWPVVLSQKSTAALNSYGQRLWDKDIPVTIVLFITILQNFGWRQ